MAKIKKRQQISSGKVQHSQKINKKKLKSIYNNKQDWRGSFQGN
jgi:hypothetical protein